MHKIHSIFPKIRYSRIKLFFKELGENYDLVKNFLLENFKEEYKEKCENKITFKKKIIYNNKNMNYDIKQETYFNKDLEGLDNYKLSQKYAEIRNSIKNHQKVFCVTNKFIHSGLNKNENNEYKSLKNSSMSSIRNWQSLSIDIIIQMWKNNKYKFIDLHGLYLSEALEVIENMDYYIKCGNCICNNIEIITGKGNNSSNHKAVLFPKIKKHLSSKGYVIKSINQGSFRIST